jgi:hypothetical protein
MIRLHYGLDPDISFMLTSGLWFCLLAGWATRAPWGSDYARWLAPQRSSGKSHWQPMDVTGIRYSRRRYHRLSSACHPVFTQ